MDINKHNRLETYATKAIRYWTSNDIIDWLKTSITTLKIEIPEEDINIYCKRVETEKCDGNCLLACEKLLETRGRNAKIYLDRAYISNWLNGWEKSPLKIKAEHVEKISKSFLYRFKQVVLRVYDVTGSLEGYQQTAVYTINQLSRSWLGGAYHVGVEIFGIEYAFGMVGVYGHLPRQEVMQHHFREAIVMPIYAEHKGIIKESICHLANEEIKKIIYIDMKKKWVGTSYDLIHRNCCHFADDLCETIGLGKIPNWINRVARSAAAVDAQVTALKSSLTVPTTKVPSRRRLSSTSKKGDDINDNNKSNTSNPNLVAMANDMLLKGQISKVEYNQLIETQKRYSNSIS